MLPLKLFASSRLAPDLSAAKHAGCDVLLHYLLFLESDSSGFVIGQSGTCSFPISQHHLLRARFLLGASAQRAVPDAPHAADTDRSRPTPQNFARCFLRKLDAQWPCCVAAQARLDCAALEEHWSVSHGVQAVCVCQDFSVAMRLHLRPVSRPKIVLSGQLPIQTSQREQYGAVSRQQTPRSVILPREVGRLADPPMSVGCFLKLSPRCRTADSPTRTAQ
mmetsp:Transcript_46383/g.74662  ORF Transcript_46383/g.74662 Transcript_46383/m.74662 type:complete len:220 (+) Transcript_46383:1205-1864(+)